MEDSIENRKKRQRYTQNACNECKRRKAKCNGATTCERCLSYKIQCVYSTPTDRPKTRPLESETLQELHTKIDLLQNQVGKLLGHVQNLSSGPSTLPSQNQSPSHHRDGISARGGSSIASQMKEQGHTPAYLGPTHYTFGLDAAEAQLEQGDNSSMADFGDLEVHENPEQHPSMDKAEVFRMIELYEDTVGTVYSCIDMEEVKVLAGNLFDEQPDWMYRTIYHPESSSGDFDRDFEILRAILAIGMVIDGDGRSEVGTLLMDRVENIMYSRFKVFEVDTKELLLLFLMSFYHFHRGDEIMAYRTTGLAARGVLEMGLHRRSTWARTSGNFPGKLQRSWAIKLFWCIYCLDRRWSLGTGLPFAIQDADMDVELPELDETTPYLRCMVAYGRLTSKVWRAVADSEHAPQKSGTDSTGYLDFLVQQWSASIPPNLKYSGTRESPVTASEVNSRRLQVLLHLKANQMRIILHKPDLLSKEMIAKNMAATHLVVDIARDTIQQIDLLNRTTDIYKKQRAAFDHFLISALAVLFLVVCYAPDTFVSKVQNDIRTGLDLVKGFLATSLSARRLWKTIRQVRHLSLRLDSPSKSSTNGIQATNKVSQNSAAPKDDQTSLDNISRYTGNQTVPETTNTSPFSLDVWPEDGFQVSRELDQMFEAFGRSNGDLSSNAAGMGSGDWQNMGHGIQDQTTTAFFDSFEDTTEFSRLVMELF